jgi:hypothetical protein
MTLRVSGTIHEQGDYKMMDAKTLVSAVLLALTPTLLPAQDMEQATQEALETLDEMSVEVNDFVGNVRFGEADVRSLIELWEEYTEFGEDREEDVDMIDFESMLSNDAYRRWASSHDLNAEDWLKKSVRITMAIYREQALEAATMMPEQMAEQMAMIEDQREQLGEENYQQMKQSMAHAASYGEAIAENARSLPEPTAAEKAVLDRYRDQLMMLMEADDEDEYYDEAEYYDGGEYEDDFD